MHGYKRFVTIVHYNQYIMCSSGKNLFYLAYKPFFMVKNIKTGQDAVNIAESFDKALDLGGVVLTKMDGDARGGAALSIKAKADLFVTMDYKVVAAK